MKGLFLFSVIALGSFASANLITNGSFEVNTNVGSNGGADDRADGWSNFTDVFAGGSPDVWDNGGVDGLAPGSFGFFPHITAHHGSNFVSIASQGSFSEGIESTAMTLIAGQTYRVSMAMAYDSHNTAPWTNPAPLTVRLRQGTNASSILTLLAANTLADTWQTRSFDFSVSATDSYSVIFSSEITSPANFFVIDAASVEAVPEPASLLALGLGALVMLRRRKA